MDTPPQAIVIGSLVTWGPHDKLGVVQSIQTDGDGDTAEVGFDDGSSMFFKREAGVLQRVRFTAGDQVMRSDGQVGVVLASVSAGDYPTWKVAFPAEVTNVAEIGLRPAILDDPLERMRAGRSGRRESSTCARSPPTTGLPISDFVSLSHARVDLMPHQVSVVHRVVSKYPHRFMLCDEVGLGKTIEAAMIIKELRARGQVERVLILVPSGLQRQWQFELKTKFNETLRDLQHERRSRYLEEQGRREPVDGARLDHRVAHAGRRGPRSDGREIAAVPWDMVIVDEAHHARAQRHGNSSLPDEALPARVRPDRPAGVRTSRGAAAHRVADAARVPRALLAQRDARPRPVRLGGGLRRARRQRSAVSTGSSSASSRTDVPTRAAQRSRRWPSASRRLPGAGRRRGRATLALRGAAQRSPTSSASSTGSARS